MDEAFWLWYSPAGQFCEGVGRETGQVVAWTRGEEKINEVRDVTRRRTVHEGEAVDDLVPAGHSEHAVLATSELLPASQGVQNTEFCCDM